MGRNLFLRPLLRGAAIVLLPLFVGVGASPSREPLPGEGGDFLLRVGGPVRVSASDTAWTVVVIGGDATIEGTLHRGLVVVDGTARISGTVNGSVVVVNGQAELGPNARLGKDLVLYRSTLQRDSGSVIAGRTLSQGGFGLGRRFLLMTWAAVTLALIVAAAVFAAVGGRLLHLASGVIERRPGRTALSAVVTFMGLPLVAFVAFLTLIGAALGFGILAILLPTLWLLGYLVAGTWLGRRLLPLLQASYDAERPYGAATLGVLAAQLIGLVPLLGGLAVLTGGALGAGALVQLAWDHWRERAPTRTPEEPVPLGAG
jgi:hypothetical protein